MPKVKPPRLPPIAPGPVDANASRPKPTDHPTKAPHRDQLDLPSQPPRDQSSSSAPRPPLRCSLFPVLRSHQAVPSCVFHASIVHPPQPCPPAHVEAQDFECAHGLLAGLAASSKLSYPRPVLLDVFSGIVRRYDRFSLPLRAASGQVLFSCGCFIARRRPGEGAGLAVPASRRSFSRADE